MCNFFFSSRRRHTRYWRDWSSDVCSSDLRGNKQKIGLIQAMFHRPPLLILDEPTGGLDPLVQEEFLEIIDEVKAEGRTVFFSSHVLSEVEQIGRASCRERV